MDGRPLNRLPQNVTSQRNTGARERLVALLLVAGAGVVAAVSARTYAGSWNDGSRLATVESLVERHTLIIDDSIFVQVPKAADATAPLPYPRDQPDLLQHGTRDRLFVNGHFYSDKSPVPAVFLAAWYQGLRWAAGLSARGQPDRFCYWMTLGSSGLAYVVAVWCIFQLGGPLQLRLSLRVMLAASFGLATVAPTYVRHVNNHILLLSVAAALLLGLARLAEETRAGQRSARRLVGLGTLAGLGYTIDLGAGPLLLVGTLAVVASRCRRFAAVAACGLAALPWMGLHHAINYLIGGTLWPANAVPEYVTWAGGAFGPENMTGFWQHQSVAHFLTYAAALLVGKRGFLGHNLPLYLALPAVLTLLRQRPRETAEIVFAAGWCAATWLVYAATSNNYSGVCASIRWFVPLLAPGYFVLGIWLRDHPGARVEFSVLSVWVLVVSALMWGQGPWMEHMVPFFWPLNAAALGSWVVCWGWQRLYVPFGGQR